MILGDLKPGDRFKLVHEAWNADIRYFVYTVKGPSTFKGQTSVEVEPNGSGKEHFSPHIPDEGGTEWVQIFPKPTASSRALASFFPGLRPKATKPKSKKLFSELLVGDRIKLTGPGWDVTWRGVTATIIDVRFPTRIVVKTNSGMVRSVMAERLPEHQVTYAWVYVP